MDRGHLIDSSKPCQEFTYPIVVAFGNQQEMGFCQHPGRLPGGGRISKVPEGRSCHLGGMGWVSLIG